MNDLKEIKRRLLALGDSNNGCVSIEDVKNIVAFIDGLMFGKENEDETKRS